GHDGLRQCRSQYCRRAEAQAGSGLSCLASPDIMFSMDRFRTLVICVALTAGPSVLLAADKGDAVKGKAVFQQCAVCHNADSDQKKMGPGLKGLFTKAKMADGKKPTEANVRSKLEEGGNGMPAYKDMLTDAEKNNLIAYLKTL